MHTLYIHARGGVAVYAGAIEFIEQLWFDHVGDMGAGKCLLFWYTNGVLRRGPPVLSP